MKRVQRVCRVVIYAAPKEIAAAVRSAAGFSLLGVYAAPLTFIDVARNNNNLPTKNKKK